MKLSKDGVLSEYENTDTGAVHVASKPYAASRIRCSIFESLETHVDVEGALHPLSAQLADVLDVCALLEAAPTTMPRVAVMSG